LKSHQQQGQLLILTGFFLLAIMVSLFAVFKSGWMTTEKTRLQAHADSAAYSAALLQARDMNFQAYMNRAMIANQAQIGQSVAMSSYMQVNQQMWYWFENIGDVARFIPGIGPFIERATEMAKTVFGGVNKLLQNSLNALTKTENLTIVGLSTASKAWHLATLASTPVFIHDLLKLNDPEIDVPIIAQAWFVNDLKNNNEYFTRADIAKTERRSFNARDRVAFDLFRGQVIKGQDTFTKKRSRRFWELAVPGYKFKFIQKGGTEFGVEPGKSRPYYSWSSVDTVGFFHKCRWFGCRWNQVPVSWGRQATWHKNTFRWKEDKSLWDNNIGTNPKAWRMVKKRDQLREGFFEGVGSSPAKVGHYKVQLGSINDGFGKTFKSVSPGLKDFYYLRTDRRFKPCGNKSSENIESMGCPIHIGVTKPVKLYEAMQDNNLLDQKTPSLQAISAGAAVFEPRISGSGKPIELANLYHPYWQPRLIELPNELFRNQLHVLASGP